ncbi:MAG: GAF domain-containing protein [Bradymonadaceae bacterium]
MGVPRLSDSNEEKRAEVVDEIHHPRLYSDPALDRVAEAVSLICEVDQAHVSIMEDETQCVVGEVGMDRDEFDRDQTFCAHTIAKNEVLLVEDATDDPRFADNPHVQAESGIRFYVGLPIVVDGVPVGTLCALDDEPRSIDLNDRGELFGAVNAVEAHLRVTYRHGRTSFEYSLSQKVTAARASATGARFAGEMDAACSEHVRHLEDDLRGCVDLLEIDEPDAESRLGYVDTDVEGE